MNVNLSFVWFDKYNFDLMRRNQNLNTIIDTESNENNSYMVNNLFYLVNNLVYLGREIT